MVKATTKKSVSKSTKTATAKKSVKKSTKKAASKKTAKKSTSGAGVDRSMAKESPKLRRKNLVLKLRQKKATAALSGVSVDALSTALGYTKFDVYGLLRGTSGKVDSNPNCLIATGHCAVATVEGEGMVFYLTAKGKKTKFDEKPFA